MERGVSYDINTWNLDFFSRVGRPKNGYLRELAPADSGQICAVGFRQGHPEQHRLVLLRSPGNRVYEFDISSVPPAKEELFADSRQPQAAGMAVAGKRIYLFFPEQSRILILERALIDPSKINLREIVLPVPTVSSATRMALVRRKYSNMDLLVLLPTSSGGFCVADPEATAPPLVRDFQYVPQASVQEMGPEVHLVGDPQAFTALISASANHRVLELNLETGGVSRVCGTGAAGLGSEGAPLDSSRLNRPGALAIYRHGEHIPRHFLRKESQDIIASDPSQVRPRTIYIADRGNHSIRRWIEIPDTPIAISNSGRRELYTLIGRHASRSTVPSHPPIPELPEKLDAEALSVSDSGFLAIATPHKILLLYPASTVGEQETAETDRAFHISDT